MTAVVFCDLVGSTGLFERLGDATASHLVTRLNEALGVVVSMNQGRVVKTLGDGIFAIFEQESSAVQACMALQREFHERPLPLFAKDSLAINSGTFRSLRIQLQMGVESGDVVEINGDCFGDAVNSAARLADLAGAKQILTTQRVFDALPESLQSQLTHLGPMFLRGKGEATAVHRVNWQATGQDVDATMVGASFQDSIRAAMGAEIELYYNERTRRIEQIGGSIRRLSMGRAANSDIMIPDLRVSREHAQLELRGNQFVLTDSSSAGTWVYRTGSSEPLILRRTDCVLVGEGEIVLACERSAENAPVIEFRVLG